MAKSLFAYPGYIIAICCAVLVLIWILMSFPRKYTANLAMTKRRLANALDKVAAFFAGAFILVVVLTEYLSAIGQYDKSMIRIWTAIEALFVIVMFLRVFVLIVGLSSLERKFFEDHGKDIIEACKADKSSKASKASKADKAKPGKESWPQKTARKDNTIPAQWSDFNNNSSSMSSVGHAGPKAETIDFQQSK